MALSSSSQSSLHYPFIAGLCCLTTSAAVPSRESFAVFSGRELKEMDSPNQQCALWDCAAFWSGPPYRYSTIARLHGKTLAPEQGESVGGSSAKTRGSVTIRRQARRPGPHKASAQKVWLQYRKVAWDFTVSSSSARRELQPAMLLGSSGIRRRRKQWVS